MVFEVARAEQRNGVRGNGFDEVFAGACCGYTSYGSFQAQIWRHVGLRDMSSQVGSHAAQIRRRQNARH